VGYLPFDGIVTKCIVNELAQKLSGGRIEKVLQPENDEIVLVIWARGETHRLVLSASASYPRIHLTNTVKDNPPSPPVFCMLLRKHLSGGRILSFQFNDYERIVGIVIESVNELGDVSLKKLIIEIMGRHSNIILVNEQDKIIDSIKHVDEDVSRVREVMPARPYVLPPAQNKISPASLDTGSFIKIMDSSSQAVEKFLLEHIKGVSPLLCREIAHRAGIDSRASARELDDDEKNALKTVLDKMISDIEQDNFSPCIVFEDEKHQKPIDFHCLRQYQYPYVVLIDSISEVLDRFYSTKDAAERLRQKKSELYKVLNTAIDRCSNKISIQQETLRDVADREKLRLYGELITANIYAIPKNAKEVTLVNYYSETGKKVTIPLDPNLSPQENAQRYFKKYAKAKSTYVYTEKQLEDSLKELEYLESVVHLLDTCTTLKEIDEVRQELSEQGYLTIKKKGRLKKQSGKNDSLSEPLRFRSSDGFDIYVGKNNRQNDYLTLKFAQSKDIWLHTKDIPGSHVIIRRNGKDIPDRTIEEAAIIAAWHSKARMSANVPVDYTAVKNVSKPSGARPGMVIYVNYKTAIVTPDKELVEGLQTSGRYIRKE